MTVWPKMARIGVNKDWSAIELGNVYKPTVIHMADTSILSQIIERSITYPLAPYTIPLRRDEYGRVVRPFIPGVCPAPLREVAALVQDLHKEGRHFPRQTTYIALARYSRLQNNSHLLPHAEEMLAWPGWSRLRDRTWTYGPWHGDPGPYNAIQTPGGRIVLIDHSHSTLGPVDLDLAKLRRHEIINNEMRLINKPVGRDDLLGMVFAGMYANHGHEILYELFCSVT